MKLPHKILMISILPLTMACLAMAIKSSYATRDMAFSALNRYAREMLDLQGTQVAHVFGGAIRDLSSLAAQPQIQTGKKDAIIPFLRHTFPLYANRFTGHYWVDLEGNVFDTNGRTFSIKDRSFYATFRDGDLVISKTLANEDDETPTVIVIVPVYNNQTRVGGLMGTLSVSHVLKTILTQNIAFNGFSVLIDSDQKVLANIPEEKKPLPSITFQPLPAHGGDLNRLVRQVDRSSGTATYGVDEAMIDGAPHFVYHRRLPPSDWTIAILFPRETLMSPIRNMQVATLVVLLFSFIFSAFFVVFLRQLVIHPIRGLMNAYRRIAENQPNVRMKISSRDEIGELGRSFNKMVDELERLRQQQLQADKALLEAKEKAEIASEQKSEFIATMSHQLRTPLQGIVGAADLIDATNQDEEIRGYINIIRNSGENLTKLINNIFDISKISSGKTELETTAFDLKQLVENCVLLVRPKALQKKLVIRSIFAEGIASSYWGDEDKLRQILINLLGNAVKFTYRGGVEIRVSRTVTERSSFHRVRIEVRDTGIGINKEGQAQMFDPYYQVGSEHAKTGTGLGLAICRKLVTVMGGEIDFSSEAGKGSRFWIIVPLKPLA